jgi:hypothetical protein
MLCRNALREHAIHNGFDAGMVYVGLCNHIDAAGNLLHTHQGNIHTLEDLVRIRQVWRSNGFLDQPAILFPLALFRSVGELNQSNHRTMDYELWGKFLLGGARFQYSGIPFGIFRSHTGQKTRDMVEQTRALVETVAAFIRDSGYFAPDKQSELLNDLNRYHAQFLHDQWYESGRLARLGFPVPIVRLLRKVKDLLKPADTLRDAER